MDLLPADEDYLEVNGLRLHYLQWGSRHSPAMVLLHGLTSHAHSWDRLATAFADRYRVVALDQRGHGDSQWAPDGAYATQDYVSDARAVIERLELGPIVLVGLSMGAHNSLAYASAHGGVTRLVSIDIPPALRRSGGGRQNGETARSSRGRAGEGRPAREGRGAQRVFGSIEEAFQVARAQNPRPPEDLHRHRVRTGLRQRPDGRFEYKYDPEAPARWRPDDLWDALAKITVPTLVVRGELSAVLAAGTAHEMAGTLPDGRLVTIDGSGHSVPLDRPDALDQAVGEFLAS